MKKICILSVIAAFAWAAFAELAAPTLSENPFEPDAPARAVAFQCVSTNLSGTVAVQKITPLTVRWTEDVVTPVTNVTEIATNTTIVVTNDVVIAWRTRYQGAGVVESNEYARAINAKPDYPPWPDIVLSTNKVAMSMVTNWVDHMVTNVVLTTNAELRVVNRAFTNTLLSATLSGGYFATNGLDAALMPGDMLRASGSALKGGRAYVIVER